MDYLQKTQYDNGGWPQCYPRPRGYSRYITFNDDAMIGAMRLLRDVVEKAKVTGIRQIRKSAPRTGKRYDKVIVEDVEAPPLKRLKTYSSLEPLVLTKC